ncbi:hypothetical protein KNP414_06180 [Paenibacillus mucilaginosus KNP414]|uniref:Uncharacterized protein n=1 Tax=Paenibacillus mucilaginosus (strain KNP414) TaxID=1036673 RepID=F8FIG0_PAEMK|nr:hypothetical protein KNP414_06180 [Paenibacillus mucilaginosus KNP414]
MDVFERLEAADYSGKSMIAAQELGSDPHNRVVRAVSGLADGFRDGGWSTAETA